MIRGLVAVSTMSIAALVLAAWLLFPSPASAYAGNARQAPPAEASPKPDRLFHMADGAILPARIWPAAPGVQRRGIILALHGFTDSRDAWEYPAPGFAAAGYTVIAPDQRGFGATASRGTWAGDTIMIADSIALAAQLRAENPGQRLIMMGESMGGAVVMCAAARHPAAADAYVLLSPAVWGRRQMGIPERSALWAANLVAPRWVLTGNEVPLDIAASDNREALLRLSQDPLTLRGANIAMLKGLVDLMTHAQEAAPNLPPDTFILSGRRDQLVPPPATAAAWSVLPASVRRGFYLSGYHLLLRDQARALVEADILAWLSDPNAWLPSGADVNAAAWTSDHAWSGTPIPMLPSRTMDWTVNRSVWPF